MSSSVGAGERLYTEAEAEYGAALERLARGYEPDPDKRRDLLQEIHIGLWRSLARFDGRCSMRTWVYRVAHNIATSHVIRRQARTPIHVPEQELESLTAAVDREDLVDRQRAIKRMYELIQELRPIDRQIVLLYLEELDAAAIGEVTGLSAGNVATRIHRIKQALQKRWSQERITS